MKFKYMTLPHSDTIFQEKRQIWILVDRFKTYSWIKFEAFRLHFHKPRALIHTVHL